MAGRPAVDLTGAKSHWIEVVSRVGSDSRGNALWTALCHACGGEFEITGNAFRCGSQRSCGCMRRVRPAPEAPFPAYRRRPAGTTLTTRERAKREEAAAGAASVRLVPPRPEDVCTYRPDDFGGGGSRPVPVCGRPAAYAGFGLCADHLSTARDAGASSWVQHSPELVALDMAATITVRCAECPDWSRETTARESSAVHRAHRAQAHGAT
jgi:hypothetical protein